MVERSCMDCKHNSTYYSWYCRSCRNKSGFEPKEENKIWITTAGSRPALNRELARQMLNSVYGCMRENDKFKIEKVIFSGPCTIVIWADKTKTIVRCQDGETFDPEKGLAMAIAKKTLGNRGSYFNEIKKWTTGYNDTVLHDLETGLKKAKAAIDNLAKRLNKKEIK